MIGQEDGRRGVATDPDQRPPGIDRRQRLGRVPIHQRQVVILRVLRVAGPSATIERDGSTDRWVARHRRVDVRSLPFVPEEFEVVAGLEVGEVIAITGIRQLRDGARVGRKGRDSR